MSAGARLASKRSFDPNRIEIEWRT